MTRLSYIHICNLALILFCSLLQSLGYLNTDTTWLLHAASSIMNGNQLYVDVMETNPPLVIWLHMAPIWLSNVTSLSYVQTTILCIGALSCLSYVTIARTVHHPTLLMSIAISITLLAPHVFAEREHLFIILFLPFLIQIAIGEKPSTTATIAAALVCLLKPFFILFLVSIYATRCIMDRSLSIVWHHSCLWVIVVGSVYAAYLFTVDLYYVQHIVPPLIAYYDGFSVDISHLSHDVLLLCGFGLSGPLLYVFHRKENTDRSLIIYCIIAAITALLTLLIQSKGWANHWYPYVALSMLGNGLVAGQLLDRSLSKWALIAPTLSVFCIVLFLLSSAKLYDELLEKEAPHHAHEMVTYLENEHDVRTIAALTFDLSTAFPAMLYAEKEYDFSFGHLWHLPGIYNDKNKDENNTIIYHPPSEMGKIEHHILDKVTKELIKESPDIMLVNTRDNYLYHDGGIYGFDFIAYFSQDPKFANWWEGYVPAHQIGPIAVYKKR